MKKIIFLLITIFLFSCKKGDNNISLNDTLLSQKEYYTMLKGINLQYEIILNESKPKALSLSEYKIALISGKIELSLGQQNEILNATKPLIDYSAKLAKKNSIILDDLSSKIAFGGLYSPNDNLNSKFTVNNFQAFNELSLFKSDTSVARQMMKINLESSEVFDCALGAIGADVLFAFSGSTASVWTVAAITKAFSAVAKKFLGPVGVAIAVISFGLCITHESLD
ncbi:MAG: hypothetical protein EBZ95_03610 [Chitinophagia bacterium]|nr:hypothetical protein [Chitinophagia bacterium]